MQEIQTPNLVFMQITDKLLVMLAPIDQIGMLEYNGCKPASCNDQHQKQHRICELITILKKTMMFNRECEVDFLIFDFQGTLTATKQEQFTENLPYGINP